MHSYLVADCKTHGCETVHVLKYLGGKPEQEIEIAMPARLWIRCRKCFLSYDYSRTDVRQVEQIEAPPPDFLNIL